MLKFLQIGIIVFLFTSNLISQTRVAILDFENTSGIAKYDGFGKAMSNMLITDLKNSIHPKKVTFLERSQLNKILEEQGLQKSKKFDNKTAVNFGKLAGVKYVLVGSVYVLDGVCNLTSRLVDVETSEIVYAKESNGKISNWLILKTNLAVKLAMVLGIPNNSVMTKNDSEINEKELSLYAKSIKYLDQGSLDSANNVLTELKYSYSSFHYADTQLDELYRKSLSQSHNVQLRQKAFILDMHNRMPNNPEGVWKSVNTFWEGTLDNKYPYLEYVFLINTYNRIKDSSSYTQYKISYQGANCTLEDMLLFSISNHAFYAREFLNAVRYQEIRNKKYPLSELAIMLGDPFPTSGYELAKIQANKLDQLNIDMLVQAQYASSAIGDRHEEGMKFYLNNLYPLLEKDFIEFTASHYYLGISNSNFPIFNPYDVLGHLIVLVGDQKQKNKLKEFSAKYADKDVFPDGKLKTLSWSKVDITTIEFDILLKYTSLWENSTLEDYRNKRWINNELSWEDDFLNNIDDQIYLLIRKCIVLSAVEEHHEVIKMTSLFEQLSLTHSRVNGEMHGLSFSQLVQCLRLRSAVALGNIEIANKSYKTIALSGLDPTEFIALHTEFFD